MGENEINQNEKKKTQKFKKVITEKKTKGSLIKKYIITCLILAICLLGVIIYLKQSKKVETQIAEDDTTQSTNEELPRFKNMNELKKVIKKNNKTRYVAYSDGSIPEITNMEGTTATADEYSKTNTQVENVDEADIVKTDGKYIYYLGDEKIYIINSETLAQESVIQFSEEQNRVYPSEIYINKNKLVVLANTNTIQPYEVTSDSEVSTEKVKTSTKRMANAIVYDLSDIKEPKKEREVAIEGSYSNSRMIGDTVYLISSKSIRYYDEMSDDDLLPIARDSAVSAENQKIDCTDIAYFPGTQENCYTIIAGFNIEKNEPANTETFYGASDEIYASENNLYIAQTDYNYSEIFLIENTETTIYKFSLENADLKLKCQKTIKGYLNDQFSMDEYEENLRVAVTTEKENRLYILDENLNEVGRIEDMAEGEEIYSVRFMGKVGYVVTYKQIDPLFVIDLSDTHNPQIKGELKIPGYSSYLHPYDETHVIGIGYNTKINQYGGTENTTIKMSMFDVSDLENPKEMFKISIGERKSSSEIISNHKALFYNKEKNLIGFPAINDSQEEFVLYNIDLEKGFTKYGKIENEQEDWINSIKRGIYIGEKLYILTTEKITEYNISDLQKINEIELN